jgi:glycosyltransferase involved in cell wall biosynthesis
MNMSLKVNTEKKKTLIVGPLPPPYHGVAVMVEYLVEGLHKRNGFDFIHLGTQDPNKDRNFGKFTPKNCWFALKSILALVRHLLLQESVRVVYVPISQNFWAFLRDGTFVLTAGLLFGKKVVIHLHGGYFKTFYRNSSRLGRRLIRFVFGYVDRGIVLGHCLRNVLEDVLPEGRIHVVYNGVDLKPFDEVEGRKREDEKFKVLFAGVLEESKGFFDVVRAVPIVKARYPHIEAIFAGRWGHNSLKDPVTTYIREHNLQDEIKFVGVVTGRQKAELFKNSDVFVFPTYFYLGEGQPVVILEAMAAKLPVISTDRGSIKEMVTDGQNGFIIGPSSPHQIAEKITILIENKNLRRSMGEVSRQIEKERFRLDQYVDGVLEVMERSAV